MYFERLKHKLQPEFLKALQLISKPFRAAYGDFVTLISINAPCFLKVQLKNIPQIEFIKHIINKSKTCVGKPMKTQDIESNPYR